jgi:hypothetical protein
MVSPELSKQHPQSLGKSGVILEAYEMNTSIRVALILFALLLAAAPSRRALAQTHQETSTLQTFSAVGKERPTLEAGKEVELFRSEGKGCLTHMWFAMDARTRIRVYVDGEKTPSIDMAQDLGHGYSHAFGGPPEPWGVAQIGRQGGVYNNYRIRFGNGVKVMVVPITNVFDSVTKRDAWWIIRGTKNLPVFLGGVKLPDSARLKLHRIEGHRAKPLEEFTIAESKGSGALYQVFLAAQGEKPLGTWEDQAYQEGCVRAYFGGSKEPTFLSSGLEDYFVSSGYFHHRKLFQTAVSGLTHIDVEKNRFAAYRFHDADPVFFQGGLRLTLRCGEELEGRVFHQAPAATYTVYTWMYEW